MATQKDLLRTAILSGAVEGMSMSEGVIDVAVPTEIPERGFSVPSPITGYCVIRVITTKGANQGGAPWFSLEHLRGTENFNGSWFATGGVATITPVTKGHEVRIATMDVTVNYLRFIKVIGGGYKRYLSSLSRSRFGGALWLRLKTTSETLPRLGVASRSRVGKLLISNLSVCPRGVGSELTSHLRTGILPYLLMQRPMLLPKSFLAMPASSCHRILQRSGLDALSLAGRGKSVNTPCTAMGSFKERRCSFIPRVACNNARMEVAA